MAAYVLIWQKEGRRNVRIIVFGIPSWNHQSFDFIYHPMFKIRIKTGPRIGFVCSSGRRVGETPTQSGPMGKDTFNPLA
jgi:hypothetical protein